MEILLEEMVHLRHHIIYCFIFLLYPFLAYSQIWQSGYPDPVENINFGHGEPVTGPAITVGSTDFKYTTEECPAKGFYTILRNNRECTSHPGNGYAPLLRDHSFKFNNSAVDGYMMIANGTDADGRTEYFADTVKNLCGGNRYLFTAFVQIAGDCGPVYDAPHYLFHVETLAGALMIEGTGGYFTTLFENGIYFDLPVGQTGVVIKIVSEPTPSGSCGNKLAIDDIQLRIAGAETMASLSNSTGWVGSLCASNHPAIKMTGEPGNQFDDPVIQWQRSFNDGLNWSDIPGATGPVYMESFTTPDTILYRTRVSDAVNLYNQYCSVNSNWLKVNIDGEPTVEVSTNSPVCSGETIKLRVENYASATWTGPNGFNQDVPYPTVPHASLSDSGVYEVSAKTLGGCKATGRARVIMKGKDVVVKGDTSICHGMTVPLHATGALSYLWSPAEGLSDAKIPDPQATPSATTVYQLTSFDEDGCGHTDAVKVKLRNLYELKAGISAPDFVCRPLDTISVTDNSSGQITHYHWSLGNGATSEEKEPPVQVYHSINDLRAYQLKLTIADSAGCADSITHILQVADNCYIAVPSAFTPNGDGKNDFLYPANAYKATNLLFRVFNRYGQLVFQTTDWTRKWDGRYKGVMQETGAYVWTLSFTDQGNNHVKLNGSTVLIR